MHQRRSLLATGMLAAALAQDDPQYRAAMERQRIDGAKLDDLEFGPNGIQRKRGPETVRQPARPAPHPITRNRYDRITARSDEDILERMGKAEAKARRRAARAGLEYKPAPTPDGFDPPASSET